jgi:5-methylcytosine-specific restriction endonuclease McrA
MTPQDLTYWVTEIHRLTSWEPDFIRGEILRRKSIQCFLAAPFWDARQWIMSVEKSQSNS